MVEFSVSYTVTVTRTYETFILARNADAAIEKVRKKVEGVHDTGGEYIGEIIDENEDVDDFEASEE